MLSIKRLLWIMEMRPRMSEDEQVIVRASLGEGKLKSRGTEDESAKGIEVLCD
jgi:hypothetical protein